MRIKCTAQQQQQHYHDTADQYNVVTCDRRRELLRITADNQAILKRIQVRRAAPLFCLSQGLG